MTKHQVVIQIYCYADFALVTDVLHVASKVNSVRKDWSGPCRILGELTDQISVNTKVHLQLVLINTLDQFSTVNFFLQCGRQNLDKSIIIIWHSIWNQFFCTFFLYSPKARGMILLTSNNSYLHIHVRKHTYHWCSGYQNNP